MTLHPAIIFTLYKLSQFEKIYSLSTSAYSKSVYCLIFAGAGMYVLAFVSILINLRMNSLFWVGLIFDSRSTTFWVAHVLFNSVFMEFFTM